MYGKLIVFEGIEGSGKTTQIQSLQQWLKDGMGQWPHPPAGVMVTRQPGGTSLGCHIRQLLLQSPNGAAEVTNTTELLLYAADRAQHVESMIRPALENGYLVLCDRYTDSTIAYQGYGRQLDLALIEQLNTIATGGLTSDITLWLRVEVATGLARMTARGETDRIEQAGLAFHQRVHEGFAAQAQRENVIAVDGSLEQTEVSSQIQALVSPYLQRWYA